MKRRFQAQRQLTTAPGSCPRQTVRKAEGSDSQSINEEWRENFRHRVLENEETNKGIGQEIPATYTFQYKKPSKLNKLSELQSTPDNSNPC